VPDVVDLTDVDQDGESAMAAEFDVVARWTMEAVQRLGPDHAIPAGCRGSASPAALAWLGEACELAEGDRLLDVGGGVGGPAAYAAERFGVRPILLEPMIGACRAAAELFGRPAIAGSGEQLPLADGAVDAAWCLGVLCTTTEKATLLAELRRVLPVGGSLGLLVFVAEQPDPPGAPEGNAFPTAPELADLMAAAGFDVLEQVQAADFAEAPLSWSERIDRVEQAVEQAHGDDPRFAVARDQEQRMARLLAAGHVTGTLLHAVAARTLDLNRG
jgi:SAM-dependent methyltransferase